MIKVFKLKYNLIVLIQTLISLANSILFLKLFGISNETDSYFISLAIIAFLQLLLVAPIEQFLFFYIEKKKSSEKEAYFFTVRTIIFVSLASVFLTLLMLIFLPFTSSLFIGRSNDELKSYVNFYMYILLVGSLFYPVNYIIDRFLNAELRFAIPYILENTPGIFILALYIEMLLFGKGEVVYVILAQALAYFIGFIVRIFIIYKLVRKPLASYTSVRSFFNFHDLASMIRNSLGMGVSHIIYQLFNPIITNILSGLAVGVPSLFYYAQRIILIVYNVVIGPSLRVFQSKFTHLWGDKNYKSGMQLLLRYLKINFFVLLFFGIIAYFAIPIVFKLVKPELNNDLLSFMQKIYLTLLLWYLVLVMEHAVGVVAANEKNSKIYIRNNIIFILIFSLISYYITKTFGVYSIGIAAFITQIVSMILYSRYSYCIYKRYSLI